MGEYADSLSKSKAAKAAETARENRNAKRDADAKAAAQAAALKQTRKEDKADVKRAKIAAGKVVVAKSTYVAPTGKIDSGRTNVEGVSESQPVTIISAPVASGIVDNVNVKEEYKKEARRIILSLVNSAKDLLIKYNFASINRVSEYALDADNESKTEYTIAYKARPEPAFTLGQAQLQDRFSLDVAQISNQISDNAPDTIKFPCFGSLVGGNFSSGSVKISGGTSLYDMKLEINSICGKDFIIKCYEIS